MHEFQAVQITYVSALCYANLYLTYDIDYLTRAVLPMTLSNISFVALCYAVSLTELEVRRPPLDARTEEARRSICGAFLFSGVHFKTRGHLECRCSAKPSQLGYPQPFDESNTGHIYPSRRSPYAFLGLHKIIHSLMRFIQENTTVMWTNVRKNISGIRI